MSSSKKKETTKATTITTPTNPAWVTNSVQGMNNRIDALGQVDPYSLVPGASPLQQQAFSSGMNLGQQPTFSWLSGLGNGGGYATAPNAGPQVMPTSAGPSTGKPSTMDTGPQVMPGSAGPSTKTAPDAGPQVMPTSAGPGGAQTQATGSQFGGGMGAYDLAGLLGFAGATAGPNLAGYTGYNAAGPAPTTGYTASGPAQVQGYNPALATAANAGQVSTYNPTTYSALTGQASTYNPTTGQAVLGQAASAGQASTYNPAMLDLSGIGIGSTQVSGIGQASSRNITDLNLNDYLNAGLGDQITAAQADYDAYNGAARAGLSASAAANGGARNSNNAIRAAVQEGELSRATNTGLANIRANAYDQAGNLATSDLNRSAQVSMANASNQTQGALAQAQIDANRASQLAGLQFQGAQGNQTAANQAGQFNAGQQNNFALTNSGYQQQTNLANQSAQNTFGLANMDAANQAGQFNAGQQNAMTQTNLGYQNQAALNNANAQNAASQWNAGAANDFALQNAGFQQQTNLANAGAQNDALSQLLGIQGQSALDYANRADTAGRFGADAWNQSMADFTGRTDAANQWSAAAFNTNSQFNAGQADNANARLLQGAGILGDLGQTMAADNRANIQLQSDLGAQQREIERQYRAAPYDQAALLQQLYAMQPYNLFNGQTSNTNSTTTQNSSSIDFARLAMAGLGFAVGGPAGAAAGYGGSGISDPRMKSNIQPLGMAAPSGDALYQFNYKGDPSGQSFIGPMANEVAQTNPQAVGMTPQGVATVDYNALGIPSPQQQAAGANPLARMAQAYQQAPASEEEQPWDLGTRQTAQQQLQANQQWIASRARRGNLFGSK